MSGPAMRCIACNQPMEPRMKATCDLCQAKRGLLTKADATAIVEENTRLRAALAGIAALQPTEPPSHADYDGGFERGQWVASEMARAALGAGK